MAHTQLLNIARSPFTWAPPILYSPCAPQGESTPWFRCDLVGGSLAEHGGHMPSGAGIAFSKNVRDVQRLLQIHADVGGDAQGRRFGLEVLNKSAIVLITAIWEAFCEDLVAEALEHLIVHVASGDRLPKELKKRVAKELKSDKNDLAIWDLADQGWKRVARARLATLTAERNTRLNTPKTAQIDRLFVEAVGLASLSSAWRWRRTSAAQAKTKLDKFVALRGAIAHRGAAMGSIKKRHVTAYLTHVKRLVAATEAKVNVYVTAETGTAMW